MGKNIVICCDGTGNEVTTNLSNVLKTYRLLNDSEEQVRYYDPGIGTLGESNPWSKYLLGAKRVFGLATGRGLDENILDAYRFLVNNYEKGDKIFLFGFSRGAYTVSALAGFIYQIGLLKPEQLNLCQYALKAYRSVPFQDDDKAAWRFSRVANASLIDIHFMGLWDTVSSIITPRRDMYILFSLQDLPHTRCNPAIKTIRLASAVDEKRRMFRLHQWEPDQEFRPNPFIDTEGKEIPKQDLKQLWFPGVHSDVGGGYEEKDSAISKFPLDWMVTEAEHAGLIIDQAMYERLVKGKERENSSREYVEADHLGKIHDSMTWEWKILEYLPKRKKWLRWPDRKTFLGFYFPCKEPRFIPEGQDFHESVRQRMNDDEKYKPNNLPDDF